MSRSHRISYDDGGNMLIEGISLDVKERSYKIAKSFKNELKELELGYKNLAITEAEYYHKMELLRDKYLEKGTSEWWTYTNKIISFEDKLLSQAEKGLSKYVESIKKMQDAFTEKLRNQTDTSYTKKSVFVGLGENGKNLVYENTYLSDLDAQKQGLLDYYNLLMKVKERGVNAFGEDGFSEFFEYIRSLSVSEGGSLSGLLLGENDENFKDFIEDFNEIQRLTENISKGVFESDTKKAISDSIENMRESLAAFGYDVPESFFESGKISAEKFSQGFISGIETMAEQIEKSFDVFMPKDVSSMSGKETHTSSSVFAPVYNLYGSGETIAEKLRSASSQATVDKLRGGY